MQASVTIYSIYRVRFLKAGMNIVDLLGILPYFASLILSLVMTATARGRETANYQASNWAYHSNKINTDSPIFYALCKELGKKEQSYVLNANLQTYCAKNGRQIIMGSIILGRILN